MASRFQHLMIDSDDDSSDGGSAAAPARATTFGQKSTTPSASQHSLPLTNNSLRASSHHTSVKNSVQPSPASHQSSSHRAPLFHEEEHEEEEDEPVAPTSFAAEEDEAVLSEAPQETVSATKHRRRRKRSHRRHQDEAPAAPTPLVVSPPTPASVADSDAWRARRPVIPSPSELRSVGPSEGLDEGVRRTFSTDGGARWVLADGREVAPPPERLSRRAQDIMTSRRTVLEKEAATRVRERRMEEVRSRPRSQYIVPSQRFGSLDRSGETNPPGWRNHRYDGQEMPTSLMRDYHDAWESHDEVVSQVVRTLQPIQVNPASASPTICRCVEYAEVGHDEKELQRLLRKDELLEAGFRAYLNLQPMQLAQVEVEELTEPSREGSTVTHRSQSRAPTSGASSGASRINAQRGVATLGGLWCTVEALREDGRPVKAQVNPPRRVVRICGGQPLSLQRPNDGRSCDARCYELLLFPQELSTNSSGVSYGSDGVTLGQMTSPPSASFPLTPRVLADDSVLREYKKKLMSRRQQEIAFQNSEDDAATFATENGVESPAAYLTMTLATISTRAKFTIDLTLVLLPYRALYADGANVLAHLPRFCPQSVGLNRRLQGLSLTFTTRDAFMSAYKALLWATECNMVQLSEKMRSTAERRFVDMQVCATASPLHPWRSSFGKVDRGTAKAAAYRGNCIDFAVMALSNGSEVEPLRLDELTFRNAADADAVVAADGTSENGAASSRCSSVVSSASGLMGLGANTAAVGHIPFGVIKRAVHSTTNEVFDVRVVPRARAQLAPIADPRTNRSERSQEQLLDQDVEAAVLLEYATRLPFLSHVRGVLVDEQKYYVVQSPWMSAAALQRSGDLTALSGDVSLPEGLQRYLDRVSLVSLSDFSRAILPSAFSATSREMEGRLQMVQLLIMQLCLLVTNLHGKGLLLGPCPPQRLLVRVEHPDSEPQCAADDTVDGDGDERSTNMSFSQDASSSCPIPCRHVQLFLSDIGMNPNSWSYERQQCGVLEYLSPNYVFGEMLERKAGEESRPWTMHDDWWCVLCLCFELLSGDALFVPSEERSSGPSATPMLSAFSSPFDVLQQWCGLLTPAARKDKSVSESVHVFVRQRVLKSVAPRIDSWISAKLEELKLFGTTSASQRKANATRSSAHGPLFGVSLASAYMHGASGGGESTCPSLAGDAADDGLDNVLKDMAWIFYYREFFDALLDVACPLERIPCSVHVPSAHLLRQPFLLSQNAPQVFDGTLPFPEAAARLLRRRMSTTRVQTLLKNYRNNLHRSGSQRHADASLMISRTPFNRNGRESEHVPLLLLAPSDSRTQGSEGSAAAASSAASERSSRTQQNRLRALYQPCELKDIAEAEDEVRGALHHGGYYAIEAPVEGASTSSTNHPHSHLTSRHSSFYVTEAARVEAARYESSHPRTGAAEESASAPGRDSHRSSGPASVRTPSRHHTQPLSEDTSFSPSPRRGSDFVEIERSLNQMASAGARSLPASPGFRHRPSGLGPEATTPAAAAESTPYHPTSAGERDDRRPPPAHPLSAHSSVRGLPQRSSHGTPRSQA